MPLRYPLLDLHPNHSSTGVQLGEATKLGTSTSYCISCGRLLRSLSLGHPISDSQIGWNSLPHPSINSCITWALCPRRIPFHPLTNIILLLGLYVLVAGMYCRVGYSPWTRNAGVFANVAFSRASIISIYPPHMPRISTWDTSLERERPESK